MEQLKIIEPDHSQFLVKKINNLDFVNSIDDNSVQLVVTSPPYNIGKSYEKKIDLDSYITSQKTLIELCLKKLKPSGSICWQVGNHVDDGEIF
ncbi:MAG: DNA methyltransferase, partial [bacterium]